MSNDAIPTPRPEPTLTRYDRMVLGEVCPIIWPAIAAMTPREVYLLSEVLHGWAVKMDAQKTDPV